MSPASLRRYRAERLLREEFRALSACVLASARGSLRACRAELDESDLEACYAQAWQGLYAATLGGQRIVNPAGWLATVTFRRAIDEYRSRARTGLRDRTSQLAPDAREGAVGAGDAAGSGPQCDIASQLDQRRKLRDLFEALRLQLSVREQQAATLCYLQGLSRSQAARTMGVSEARMRKLMEGTGSGRPGVAAKVTALLDTIGEGEWCAAQGSLMRGLAYGILDPAGERHRLALIHTSACPACRAYVASLRGLAALLPPAPSLLPLLLAGGAGAKATGLGAGLARGAAWGPGMEAASGGGATSAAPHGTGAGGALFGPGAMSPAAAGAGAAGAGAAGGGWLLAGGGVSAKLAAGCLLALGVGAGCAVLGTSHGAAWSSSRAHARARAERASRGSASAAAPAAELRRRASPAPGAAGSAPAITTPVRSPAASSRASREFGPEQVGAPSGGRPARPSHSPAAPTAVAASSASGSAEFAPGASPSTSAAAAARGSTVTRSSGASSAAQREFSPG